MGAWHDCRMALVRAQHSRAACGIALQSVGGGCREECDFARHGLALLAVVLTTGYTGSSLC
jgi:hypothetical protein